MNEDSLSDNVNRRRFITGASLVGTGIAVVEPVRAADEHDDDDDFDAEISFDDDCRELVVEPDDDDEEYVLEFEVDDGSFELEATGRVELTTDDDEGFSRAIVEHDGDEIDDEECDPDDDDDDEDFDAEISFDDDCQELLVEPTDDDEEYTVEAEIDDHGTFVEDFEGTVRLELDDSEFERVTVEHDDEEIDEETCS